MSYKQSHPVAAFREIVFHLDDAGGAPLTGQTFATTDLQVRKPGANAYVNCNATQQTAVVDYAYRFTAAELDTVGDGLVFKVNKAGALAVLRGVNTVERAYFLTAVTGTLAANTFTTDRSEAVDGYWRDAFLVAVSGALIGQVKKVGGYTGANKQVTLVLGLAFTSAPVNGDLFEIINR